MAGRISLDFTKKHAENPAAHSGISGVTHSTHVRGGGPVRLLVLDILKPHRPSALEYAQELSKIDSSYSVNIKVVTIDERTETVQVIIEGNSIDYKKVEDTVLALGGNIQSIDEVCVGAKLIDSRK